jgi:hypothetical protein
MSSLTTEQLAFLAAKGVPLSRVFDATGMTRGDYQDAMKPLDYWLAFGVSPCSKLGHQLRTRAGHCAQCDPKKISFVARHDKPGQLYVAHSQRRHYTKVGSATDAEERIRSLNSHQYGNIDDWKLAFKIDCKSAGDMEFLVHKALSEQHLPRNNSEGANSMVSKELFACEPAVAINAIQSVLASKAARRA